MNPVESVTSRPLKLLIFLGSVRKSTPPKPARLGLRVAQACKQLLDKRLLDIELIDPLNIELDTVFKPHFSYAKNNAPKVLDILADKIQAADGYVMVSPEYNHCMSPALANLLNHFGSSLFAFKPSAIVTYSAGQWGGARAAVNMRTFLSELGCLPVSAMIHIPYARLTCLTKVAPTPLISMRRFGINISIVHLINWFGGRMLPFHNVDRKRCTYHLFLTVTPLREMHRLFVKRL